MSDTTPLLDDLLGRCTFPTPPSAVDVAFSGGPDSTALVLLAHHAGLDVTAHHVDHGLRAESAAEAERAGAIAARVGVAFRCHTVSVVDGPNVEARARAARAATLPPGAMTGHTADDQAETVLLRLLRGSGATGLGAMQPGHRHPILALRRADTAHLCADADIEPVHDASNARDDVWRNRVRHEVLPLLAEIGRRDPVPILARTADLARDDAALLDLLAADLDPTDARQLTEAPAPLARRALRRWLTVDGYPPDAAAIERVRAVAAGAATACELAGGRRVRRSQQRLIVDPATPDVSIV